MPRIAYVISMANGMDAWLHREVRALKNQGVEIVLYTTIHTHDSLFGPEAWDWKFRKLNGKDFALALPGMAFSLLHKGLFKLAVKTRTLKEFLMASYFVQSMRKDGIEHIHAQFMDKKLTVAYYCAEMLGLPLTATGHAHDVYFCQNVPMLQMATRRAEKLFTISDLGKKFLVDRYGVQSDKIEVRRLFVEAAEYQVARENINILIVGRLDSVKGHKYLFQAVKLLQNPALKVLVAGSGAHDVAREAQEAGVADQVVFMGRLGKEALKFMFSKADIYCNPSIIEEGSSMEGVPVSLMEAMAAGLPVIATDTGAIHELVQQILVPQKDAEKLAQALKFFVENPEERVAQGRRNFEIVKNKYSDANFHYFAADLLEVTGGKNSVG